MKRPWLAVAWCGLAVAAEPACVGRPAVYDPSVPPHDTDKSPSVAPDVWVWWRDIPVAFAASGDACAGPVPVYSIGDMFFAFPARDTHAMARRLAPTLADFSRRTGWEACARMCTTDEGKVVAQAVTLRAHVTCAAPDSTCPVGSRPTPETIHSHPPHRVFVANAVDALGWEDPSLVGQAAYTGNPDMLSPPDRLAAPVWLVGTRGQLIWLATPDGQEVERP